MSDEWSEGTSDGWEPVKDTPYQHWWLETEQIDISSERSDDDRFRAVVLPTILTGLLEQGRRVFMPAAMTHREPEKPIEWDVEQVRCKLEKVEDVNKDTVIIGIVDAGIALGHRRFRMPSGKTRFLAAWQQGVDIGRLRSLPFGDEFYERDINDKLLEYSGGDLKADLDEEAFNRDLKLVMPEHTRGQRALDYHIAHGTHVLDLFAGLDPKDAAMAARRRIIAVNLPSRKVHGSAGNLLPYLARNAVERILFLAGALWTVKFGEEEGGFPVVINFSFGLLAGPKNGNSLLEQQLKLLIETRNIRAPTRLVMPAGNSNLSRGNARKMIGNRGNAKLGRKDPLQVDPVFRVRWRIFPSDYTSNFVEIWTKARECKTGDSATETPAKEFSLWVTPPGSEKELLVPALCPGQYSKLSNYARVYCYKPPHETRAHFIICVASTLRYDHEDRRKPEAPAGLWNIALRHPQGRGDIVHEVTFTVQSDQAGVPHAVIGRQSYFDDENYRTHLESGELRDSYGAREDRPPDKDHFEPWDKYGPVQRKGTQNALATWDNVLVIGGYRESDMRPSIFSATFDGKSRRMAGRDTMNALCPAEDGPAHFGLLAAGARDGSTVAVRGTSMASALAARTIADELDEWLRDPNGDHTADGNWLKKRAHAFRAANPDMKHYNSLKEGNGFVPCPDLSRDLPVERLSRRWNPPGPVVSADKKPRSRSEAGAAGRSSKKSSSKG